MMNLGVFVEGGIYMGGTAKDMSVEFSKVYTIEKSDDMFEISRENLKNISNIVLLKGNTRKYFSEIFEQNNNILFWLDAHWSGGDTYGEEDECPLIKELEIIFQHSKNYVILIDDARLFLSPPPLPHKIKNWPSLLDIIKIIPSRFSLLEFEYVFYIYPVKIENNFKIFI